MEQKPLWNESAEQSVIGALIIDDRVMTDVAAVLQPADFYHKAHREIFQAALDLHGRSEPIDVQTLTEAVRPFGHIQMVGQIAVDVPSAANVSAYADIVQDYSRRRALVAACSEAVQAASRTRAGDLIAELSGRIEQAGTHAIGQSMNFQSVLETTMRSIEAASNVSDNGVIGVPTDIPMVDAAMSGLCPQRLIVLAARPSIGKTALANQWAVNAARRGYPGGICSLEMGEEELGARAMAYHCRANFTRLLRGRDDAMTAMVNGMKKGEPSSWPLHLDTSTYSLSGIEARITSWRRTHDIRYAIVDHIGLIELEKEMSEYDRISMVTRRLKKLAKRLNIAVVAISQLNRSGEKEKRRPTLADFRGSGSVEQDVDTGLFLHVEPEDDGQATVPVYLGFLKNRTGRKGWLPKPLLFEGAYQTFVEQSTVYDNYGVEA